MTAEPTADDAPELLCSARGCHADATWGVLWNNPKLHTPDRRKVWLACDDHRVQLEEYLGARLFFKESVRVAALDSMDLGTRPGAFGR